MVISYLKASKAIPKTAAKMQLTSPNMDLGDFLTVTPIEKKPTQKIYPTPKHCNFTSNNVEDSSSPAIELSTINSFNIDTTFDPMTCNIPNQSHNNSREKLISKLNASVIHGYIQCSSIVWPSWEPDSESVRCTIFMRREAAVSVQLQC